MPATMQEIGAIMNSPEFSESDKWVVKWQFRLLGDFETALVAAFCAADQTNQSRLGLGFPMQLEGYKAWAYGDLGRRLRKAGLDI